MSSNQKNYNLLDNLSAKIMLLHCRSKDLDLSKKTHIMGIVNITPDSFSDGGLFLKKDDAIKHALKLINDGADIIDIGGESTRPGAQPVSIQQELDRTIPVIESLSGLTDVPISIDTYKSNVAEEAIKAGASIVNDISGLGFDEEMAGVVAKYNVPVIIMHIKGTPKDMQTNPTYHALIPEIMDYFRIRIKMGLDAGIDEKNIIIDPGIGFGKTFNHNLEILNRLCEFSIFEMPIAVGVSRKSFIGAILGNLPPSERLAGSIGASAIAAYNGANILRVHDVKETKRAVMVVDAIKNQSMP
ncbi:MAG: dihydropteroate synthase [Thermodesulfovibrionales bacterium]|nr:dihydropteroate synthase [Thermodesulfovibrionales bacterium]